jgi:hypothetical protein
MTDYRTPAPIFSIKRPRQALFAHPANSFGVDENALPELGIQPLLLSRVVFIRIVHC